MSAQAACAVSPERRPGLSRAPQVQPRLTVAAFDSGLRKAAPRGSVDARRASRAAASAGAASFPSPRRGDPRPLASALAARGIPACVAPDGAQGDDVLASLAAAASGTPLRVLIASGDADVQSALRRRDADTGAGGCDWLRVAPHPSARHPAVLELVTWQARVLFHRSLALALRLKPDSEADTACLQSFFERYGFLPERYAVLGALLGRPRDAVPSCRGVGDRAAAALVRAYGDVDAMLQAAGASRHALSCGCGMRSRHALLTRGATQRTASCGLSGPRWPPRCWRPGWLSRHGSGARFASHVLLRLTCPGALRAAAEQRGPLHAAAGRGAAHSGGARRAHPPSHRSLS